MIEVDVAAWPCVELDGATYAVSPRYLHGVAIGDGPIIAGHHGCELPTPALVDAIWRAADCRLPPLPQPPGPAMVTHVAMVPQARRIAAQIADWERRHGVGALLVAGTHKDVVAIGSRVGIYGWHRLDGRPIQSPSTVHAPGYRDYSQGLRLVRRVAP